MKINWGTGLVIGMVLFIGFILFFVVQIMTDKQYDYDLVTEDYYQKELVFQQELNALENSNTLADNLKGERTDEGWEITFPKDMDYAAISGTVQMYRPSNKNLDFQVPVKLSGQKLVIPNEQMVGGRWNVIVNWNYQGTDYLYKQGLYY